MAKNWLIVFAVMMLVLLAGVPLAIAQQTAQGAAPVATPTEKVPTIDPKVLIGWWGGDWKAYPRGHPTGKFDLTIKRLEGDLVYGIMELGNTSLMSVENFQTKLEGSVLKIVTPYRTVELTIDDGKMSGMGRSSQYQYSIELTRRQ